MPECLASVLPVHISCMLPRRPFTQYQFSCTCQFSLHFYTLRIASWTRSMHAPGLWVLVAVIVTRVRARPEGQDVLIARRYTPFSPRKTDASHRALFRLGGDVRTFAGLVATCAQPAIRFNCRPSQTFPPLPRSILVFRPPSPLASHVLILTTTAGDASAKPECARCRPALPPYPKSCPRPPPMRHLHSFSSPTPANTCLRPHLPLHPPLSPRPPRRHLDAWIPARVDHMGCPPLHSPSIRRRPASVARQHRRHPAPLRVA